MSEPKVGDRVIAASDNPIYDGQVGIVDRRLGEFFYVDFDFVGKPGNEWENGGSWSLENLTVVDAAEVVQLTAEVAAHEASYAALADDLRGLRADYDRTFAALGRESKILTYALSLLGKRKRAQVRGFTEAL